MLKKPPAAGSDLNSTEFHQWLYELWNQIAGGGTSDFDKTNVGDLTAKGTIRSQDAVYHRTVTVTQAAYTMLLTTPTVFIDATGGNRTVTLPPANMAQAGYSPRLLIRRIDASGNTVTVAAASGDTVDGVASITIAASSASQLETDGSSKWWSF